MSRNVALLAIVLFNYVHPLSAINYQNELPLYSDHNKALYGHSFSNFSRMTLKNCLGHFLLDCLCLSFQICNNNDDPQCQLCSSNKYLNPSSLKQSEGCTNYNFRSQDDKEVSRQQTCSQNIPIFNCCLTSANPCLNGGKCVPPMSSNRTRYRCDCTAGYTGDHCGTKCNATSLLFKTKSVNNYAISRGVTTNLKSITVSFWVRTTQIYPNAFFMTYFALEMDDAFAIFGTSKRNVVIAGTLSTLVTNAPVHDGNWHHLCITWRSQDGAFAIYRDGIIVGNGTVAEGIEIPSGGAWVLGHEQDTVGGGFAENQAFEGELAEAHIFDKVLSEEEIFEMKETCAQCIREGNVISWNEFRSGVHGDVQEVPATFC